MNRIPMNLINRKIDTPLYIQLAKTLKTQIHSGLISGEFSNGDLIPSERELMRTYQVSRNTVRKAIDELIRDHVIYSEQGRGNYIVSANLAINSRIDIFCEHNSLLKNAGYQPRCELIETEIIFPDSSLCDKLQLAKNDEVQYIKKVFYADDKPAILCIDFVPLKNRIASLEGIEYQGHNFFNFLRERGRQPIEFILADILPVSASEEISELLNCSEGAPLLLLHELMLDPSQKKPVMFANNYYLTELIHFSLLRRRLE